MNLYFNDNTNFNVTKLFYEMSTLSFKEKIDYYEITEKFVLKTKQPLSLDQELELKKLLDKHTTDYIEGSISEIVDNSIEFGHKILLDFSRQNIILGITEAGLTEAVLDYLEPIKSAVQTGSLYLVITKIDKLIIENVPQNLNPFVSNEKLSNIKLEIENYLAGK